MSTTKRDQVLKQFQTVEAEIEKMGKFPKTIYATASKYIPKVGSVNELETVKDLLKAQKVINEQKDDFAEAAKTLGVEAEEEEITFMGFPLWIWDNDLKLRLEELKREQLLAKYEKAKKVLKKNLSADDKFDLAMSSISDVLSLDELNS
jgi:hypothetical protein